MKKGKSCENWEEGERKNGSRVIILASSKLWAL